MSLVRRSSPLMYQITNSLIRRKRRSKLRLGFNDLDTLCISQNAKLHLASSQKKVLKVGRDAGWILSVYGEEKRFVAEIL